MAKAALAKTGGQGRVTVRSGMSGAVFGSQGGFAPPPPKTYETYRLMRCDPTIALARAVATAPIKAAGWSVEAKDNARDDAVDLVMSVFMPMMPTLVRDCCFGIDYGWQGFEKVWKINREGRAVFGRMKPLLPDITQVLVDEKTGAFSGVRNKDVELPPTDCLVYTHDMEGGDYYGRSRHENLRQYAWSAWNETHKQAGKYMAKAAGIIPMMSYPVGESKGEDGTMRPNSVIAKNLLRTLESGVGIAMPRVIDSMNEDLIRQGVRPDDLAAWQLKFIEAGSDHTVGFERMLRYFDSTKMRGWLVPERVALEGQHGTLAESGEHADVALSIGEETLHEIARHINWYAVDDLLAVNFGEDARGSVELVPAPLVDADKSFYRGVITTMMSNPAAYETAQMLLDIDALLDVTGLPKAQEVVDQTAVPGMPTDAMPIPTTTPQDSAVADSALTGIQITSLRELVNQVTAKQLPPESAKAIARVSFPNSDPAMIDRAIDTAARFTPATPVAASRGRSGWHSRGPLVMGRSGAEILRRVRQLPQEREIAVAS